MRQRPSAVQRAMIVTRAHPAGPPAWLVASKDFPGRFSYVADPLLISGTLADLEVPSSWSLSCGAAACDDRCRPDFAAGV